MLSCSSLALESKSDSTASSSDELSSDAAFLRHLVVVAAWGLVRDDQPLHTHCFLQLVKLLPDVLCLENYKPPRPQELADVATTPALMPCAQRTREHLKRNGMLERMRHLALDMARVMTMQSDREIRFGNCRLQSLLFAFREMYSNHRVRFEPRRPKPLRLRLPADAPHRLLPVRKLYGGITDLVRLCIADYSTSLAEVQQAHDRLLTNNWGDLFVTEVGLVQWCLPHQLRRSVAYLMGERWCKENLLCAVPVHTKMDCMQTGFVLCNINALRYVTAIRLQKQAPTTHFATTTLYAMALLTAPDNCTLAAVWRHVSLPKKGAKELNKALILMRQDLYRGLCALAALVGPKPYSTQGPGVMPTHPLQDYVFSPDSSVVLKVVLGSRPRSEWPELTQRVVRGVYTVFMLNKCGKQGLSPPHTDPSIYPLCVDPGTRHMVFLHEVMALFHDPQSGADTVGSALLQEAMASVSEEDVPGISLALREEAQQPGHKRPTPAPTPAPPRLQRCE